MLIVEAVFSSSYLLDDLIQSLIYNVCVCLAQETYSAKAHNDQNLIGRRLT